MKLLHCYYLLYTKKDNLRWLYHILLACLSGILLGLAWIANPLFSFVGFVPLLYLVGKVGFWSFGRLCYLAFLVWHFCAVWWLPYVDIEAGLVMFSIVPALFTIPMLLAYTLNSQSSNFFAFLCTWLAYEYVQYRWDFLWSWLTIGNCFAARLDWIWFYTFTGTLGGSVWIWLVNIAIYQVFSCFKKPIKPILVVILLLFPIWISFYSKDFLFSNLVDEQEIFKRPYPAVAYHHILILQPNIDPLTQKLSVSPTAISPVKQAEMLIEMMRKQITLKTDLVVFPEAILGKWFEHSGLEHIGNYPEWDTLRKFFDQYPETSFLIGMNIYRWVHGAEQNDYTAHQEGKEDYRKRYNATMLYQKGQPKQFHYKSKRVPAGEYLPFPHFLKPLFPAISNTLTPADAPQLLITKKGLKIGSLICYESTFGNYAGEICRQGADILCVVTEDAYWRDTPQPRQHLQLDQLRALEHQINIFRASNHGLSGFIMAGGKLKNFTKTDIQATISLDLPAHTLKNNGLTFYSRFGDWIGLMALIVLFILLLDFFQPIKMPSERGEGVGLFSRKK